MSSTRKITTGLIIATIVIWIGWDIYVAIETASAPHGDTESEVIRDFSWSHPFFPFAVGVLMGHFFWTRKKIPSRLTTIPLAIIGVVVLVLDVTQIIPRMLPLLPFLAGIPLGHFLWPQAPKVKE